MERPQSPQEWQRYYEAQARKQEAAVNRQEREATKAGPPEYTIHPMILSRHNTLDHVREAERVVTETQAR